MKKCNLDKKQPNFQAFGLELYRFFFFFLFSALNVKQVFTLLLLNVQQNISHPFYRLTLQATIKCNVSSSH